MRRNRHPATNSIHDRIDAAVASDKSRVELMENKRVSGNHDAPLISKAEQSFRQLMLARGAQVLRAGWPDFVVVTAGGAVIGVEVKSDADRMRPAQVKTFDALERAGLRLYVWWERRPDSLMNWRAFLRITTDARQGRAGSSGVGARLRAAIGAFVDPDSVSKP